MKSYSYRAVIERIKAVLHVWDQYGDTRGYLIFGAGTKLLRDDLRAVIEGAQQFGPSRADIPEGWKLVPKKPTMKMIHAAEGIGSQVGDGPVYGIHYPAAVGPEDVYEVMLGAAPRSECCGMTMGQSRCDDCPQIATSSSPIPGRQAP